MGKDTHISILGVMSGTSLDGLDLCLVDFSMAESIVDYNIVKTETISFDSNWKSRLSYNHGMTAAELAKTDADFGRYVADQINIFLKDEECDFIASHGQTILHQVDMGYTRQIGNGGIISSLTNLPVVSDFRTQDVALGGQGAPLVPIGDRDLFSNYQACLNIGGFSNISEDQNGTRIAYDVCPVNYVLNSLAKSLELPYDKDGAIAANNSINSELLKVLLHEGEIHLTNKKSLGAEYVEQNIIPVLEMYNLSVEDKISTYTEFCAIMIANALCDVKQALVTGGGAYNKTLIKRISDKTNCKITVPDSNLLEFKEALIFAYLGFLRWHNRPNVISSVTGAKRDSVSGAIYYP